MLKFYAIISAYFILFAAVLLCFSDTFIIALLLGVLTFIFLIILVWGVSNIRSQMFYKTFNSNPKAKGKVAITFDDGPDSRNTILLLELLERYGAKASFFLIGQNIKNNRSIAERIHSEGHLIGNHSYFHNNLFPAKSTNTIVKELEDTQVLLKNIKNQDNIFFRPPFGVSNPNIAKAVSKIGLTVVGWNIRSFDTRKKLSREKVVQNITKNLKSGDIILMHDYTEDIPWVLEQVLEHLAKSSLVSVTVEQLME